MSHISFYFIFIRSQYQEGQYLIFVFCLLSSSLIIHFHIIRGLPTNKFFEVFSYSRLTKLNFNNFTFNLQSTALGLQITWTTESEGQNIITQIYLFILTLTHGLVYFSSSLSLKRIEDITSRITDKEIKNTISKHKVRNISL